MALRFWDLLDLTKLVINKVHTAPNHISSLIILHQAEWVIRPLINFFTCFISTTFCVPLEGLHKYRHYTPKTSLQPSKNLTTVIRFCPEKWLTIHTCPFFISFNHLGFIFSHRVSDIKGLLIWEWYFQKSKLNVNPPVLKYWVLKHLFKRLVLVKF